LAWEQELDAPRASREAKEPRPTKGKITRLSVTQGETLIRDPYALYARRVLGLEVLEPIGAIASHRERGNALHKAIERFEDGEELAEFLRLLDEELAGHGIAPERRAAEAERLVQSAVTLIDWFKARRDRISAVFRECKGELKVAGATLSGIADRIEIGPGHAAILDFKTGKPPSEKQVISFAPQLLLEAAMLARGAFTHEEDGAKVQIEPAPTRELFYWWFGGADPAALPLDLDVMAEAEKALKALDALLTRYETEQLAFLCKPRVQFIKSHSGRVYTDYDQLARRKEWADADGGDE